MVPFCQWCENPEKGVVGQKLGGGGTAPPAPPGITPCYWQWQQIFVILYTAFGVRHCEKGYSKYSFYVHGLKELCHGI